MKIFLHSVYRETDASSRAGFYDSLQELAQLDRHRRHRVAESIEGADCVLITEVQSHLDDWRFSRFWNSPVVRRWAHKGFVYCDVDRPMYLLPGLYPSVSRRLQDPCRQESFCYLGMQPFEADEIFQRTSPELLFSFSGQLQNHPCRRGLAALCSSRSEIIDTSGIYIFSAPHELVTRIRARYREQVANSKFVLCPRGVGTSSYRLFETMAAGRVPVIISDEWVEPIGPDWSEFSVRIPEDQVAQIPRILDQLESRWVTMATKARCAFAEYFGKHSQFNSLGDCLDRLRASQTRRPLRYRGRRYMAFSAQAGREGRRRIGCLVKGLVRREAR